MSVELKRGCGWRKAGGTYLVGGGIGVPCDRLPFELSICPCCSIGFKPSLGWTWIRPGLLFQGPHVQVISSGWTKEAFLRDTKFCSEASNASCWLCADPGKFERTGLLWIGGKFYPSPTAFMKEGLQMGFSRRIRAVPQGFRIGQPIFLAHRKTIERPPIEEDFLRNPKLKRDELIISVPGIFYVWIPERIEKIFNESERSTESVQDAEKRGIVPVFVPDNDPDHHGSVYDKVEED
jgi:hypothetical protein